MQEQIELPVDPKLNFLLCVWSAILTRNSDLLSDLYNSTIEENVPVTDDQEVLSAIGAIAEMLSDSDREWFRLSLGGERHTTKQSDPLLAPIAPTLAPKAFDGSLAVSHQLISLAQFASEFGLDIQSVEDFAFTSPLLYCFAPNNKIDRSRCGLLKLESLRLLRQYLEYKYNFDIEGLKQRMIHQLRKSL